MSEATTAAFASLEALLEERHRSVEAALREQAPRSETPELLDALNACLFAPGQRLRPILALLVRTCWAATRAACCRPRTRSRWCTPRA